MNIVHGIQEYDKYFELKSDCTRLLGFSSIQKCSVALQLMAELTGLNVTDEELGGAPSEGVDVASSSFPSIMNRGLSNQ